MQRLWQSAHTTELKRGFKEALKKHQSCNNENKTNNWTFLCFLPGSGYPRATPPGGAHPPRMRLVQFVGIIRAYFPSLIFISSQSLLPFEIRYKDAFSLTTRARKRIARICSLKTARTRGRCVSLSRCPATVLPLSCHCRIRQRHVRGLPHRISLLPSDNTSQIADSAMDARDVASTALVLMAISCPQVQSL